MCEREAGAIWIEFFWFSPCVEEFSFIRLNQFLALFFKNLKWWALTGMYSVASSSGAQLEKEINCDQLTLFVWISSAPQAFSSAANTFTHHYFEMSAINISAGGSAGNRWGTENELESETQGEELYAEYKLRMKLRDGGEREEAFSVVKACENKRIWGEKGQFRILWAPLPLLFALSTVPWLFCIYCICTKIKFKEGRIQEIWPEFEGSSK